MSTRGAITITETPTYCHAAQVICFYHHCDMYPEGMAAMLHAAIKEDKRRGMIQQLIAAAPNIEILGADCNNWDLEFFYTINADTLTITAEERPFNGNPRQFFSGAIWEFCARFLPGCLSYADRTNPVTYWQPCPSAKKELITVSQLIAQAEQKQKDGEALFNRNMNAGQYQQTLTQVNRMLNLVLITNDQLNEWAAAVDQQIAETGGPLAA